MDRRFLTIIAVVLLAFGGLFYFARHKSTNSSSNSSAHSNHSVGAGLKGVELTEYGDFQCPACGQFYPLIEAVRGKYGDDLKFTFRNFPLDSVHQNARAAHRAAEAAGKQNKFFDMYNKLYSSQSEWSQLTNPVPVFEQFATQLGLNLAQFKTDFASPEVNDTINADVADGQSKQVDSTPSFFINGQKVDNSTIGSIGDLTKLIDEAIVKAGKTAATPAATPESTPTE